MMSSQERGGCRGIERVVLLQRRQFRLMVNRVHLTLLGPALENYMDDQGGGGHMPSIANCTKIILFEISYDRCIYSGHSCIN